MSAPFTFNGILTFPADPGGSGTPISISFANQFTQIIAETLSLTGSGTKTIDTSALNGGAGASCLLLKMDPSSVTTAVSVALNSSSPGIELSPGGFIVIGDQTPVSGIISVAITYAVAALVRLWALG